MSSLFELGVIHYTHPVIVIVSVSPPILEYIEFVMGMHLQEHWGDVSEFEASISDIGLIAGTIVTSHYELVEEFELIGEVLVIITDLILSVTVVSVRE